MIQKVGSSQHDMMILLNQLPGLNMANKTQKQQMLRLIFDTDEQRSIFEDEIRQINFLLKLPLKIYAGNRLDIGSAKESTHAHSTVAAALREDGLRIFEELRDEKLIGRKLTAEQAAWAAYFLLVRKCYPEIYQKFFASIGLHDFSRLRAAHSAFVRQFRPKFKHLTEIDRKYDTYNFSEIGWQLFGQRIGYLNNINFEMYPLATEKIQYDESLMKQARNFSELVGRASFRTAVYIKSNDLAYANYSLMVGLFFQACIDFACLKIFIPKPVKEWIAYGIPERSFYHHLEGMKRTFP
ncbi:MAG TPA: hypothetical protein VF354_01745, partial [Candidatus Methanoperedens sp.]